MPTQPEFSVKAVITYVIDDIAKAISEHQGEGKQNQSVRAGVATTMIEDFHPSDVVQVMLAGQCVMFHAVMINSIRETLRGELETMRHATRSNIVAMNRSFHMNLDRLDRCQMHAAASQAVAPDAAVSRPENPIQPEPLETPAPQVTPTLEVSRSRVPIGAAQPRRPQELTPNTGAPATGHRPVPAEPGETAFPRPSASISSRT
jgi:hypothetical protein